MSLGASSWGCCAVAFGIPPRRELIPARVQASRDTRLRFLSDSRMSESWQSPC